MRPLEPAPLAAVEEARRRLGEAVIRTPLLRLDADGVANLWLKLENLQPIGSFKVRGAGNAIRSRPAASLAAGVTTASAGNMAQGVAWWARRLGLPAAAIVPDQAPETKTSAIERLGGRVVRVPYDRWWQIILGQESPPGPGAFIHPVADPDVMAGNGTIGLEILEDLPEVETILVPFGGGGLACGIAAAVRPRRPAVRVLGCEVETAAPLAAALAAGRPVTIARRPSFVDGIGGMSVLPAMWPVVRSLVDGVAVVSLDAIAQAIRLLVARGRVVAEGAAGAAVAAALAGHARGPTVCVVSGGNLQAALLARILEGVTP